MFPIISDFDVSRQRARFWGDTWDMLVRLRRDMQAGQFDSDADARAEAARLYAEVVDFYGLLLA